MSNTNAVLVRMPRDFKQRLQELAQTQGVSVNQLINYALSREVSYMDARSYLDQRLADKFPEQIRKDFDNVMEKVKDRDVPDGDKL